MAAQWFCQIGGQQYGPVDFPTLQAWGGEGRIQPDDLVWSEGMANWQPAKTISGLLPLSAANPPGVPAGAQSPPPFNPYNSAPFGYQAQRWAEPHRGTTILVLGICGFLCCIPAIIAWSMGSTDLAKMKAGTMDPAGKGMTMAGYILGIVFTCLNVLGGILGVIGNFAAHSGAGRF